MSVLKKYTKVIFYLASLLISFVAFLSSLAGYVSPQTFWWLAVFGLAFIYVYLLNFFVFVFWLWRKSRIVFITLIPLLTGFGTFLSFFNFSFSNSEKAGDKNLSVMTYNVRIFDLYNWTKNLETRKNIISFLHKQNPDVLCMQEFFTSNDNTYNNLDTLKQTLKANNTHTLFPVYLYGTDFWGLATFTTYPIVKKEIVFSDKESANGCIATDIKIGTDTVRIYNAHLQSVRFSRSDYTFVKNMGETNATGQWAGIKEIVVRLKRAFKIRATQAETLAEHINNCPYPIVLCGDFNDIPSSYAYHVISNSLLDSFTEKGKGFSSTYIGVFPWLRIDYILHSKNMEVISYQKLPEKLSDHYAVKAFLKF